MQKTVLLFGAGKSATVLIDYLIDEAKKNDWKILIADSDKEQILLKTNNSPFTEAFAINVENDEQRLSLIKRSNIVISLMPPGLHFLIAKDCVHLDKNLLTASYVDQQIKDLQPEIEKKGLLFICEMGLDPGVDHMSAMRIIDLIRNKGAKILSFKSHCGGLVAPESDNNPWRYKISWNPRNIVMAGKAGAVYKIDGNIIQEKYEELFDAARGVEIPGLGFLSYYPNRDSRDYMELYNLNDADTFMRTTLRYQDFMYGWKNIVELKLTDEAKEYETGGMLLCDFFKQHLDKNGFGEWLQQNLTERFSQTKKLLEDLMKLMETENEAEQEGEEIPENFMMVDEEGDLQNIELDNIKTTAAATLANQMHEANLMLKQLFYLGMDDNETLINKGICGAADVLQFAMEKKLALQPGDKDMIVMLHELVFKEQNKTCHLQSSMIVKGENNLKTAMAKTVGLPLGIAAKLILNNTIKLSGLHIPIKKEIYEPVLAELENFGINFIETVNTVSE
jgi:saccharopine dehydrogenase-like NADP-dependent oxidoreductase